LVAAAAMVGGIASITVPAAQAGTVAVKGDTAVNMYGFIRFEVGYASDMASSIYNNVPVKTDSDDESYQSNAQITRIGFNFNNADANVGGKIEGDFWGGKFRIRHAYIKHTFDNFYLQAGRYWGIELDAIRTFSPAWVSPAGFNGASRAPQVQLGGSFDLGGATLKTKLAFEDVDYTGNVIKKTFPVTAAYVATDLNTGFGKPAEVYALGMFAPVKISTGTGTTNKTGYAYAIGVTVPVSMVTVQGEYLYGKGMNGLAGASITPASYIGDDAQKFYAWNAEAKISPVSCLSFAAGYDYLKFKGEEGYKMYTVFGNVQYKTTKHTTLKLEWQHADIDGGDNGDRYYAAYVYSF
jgi:hypothetical protein